MKLCKFKLNGLNIITLTIFILLPYSCDKKEETENKSPTCTITSPINGDEFEQGATVTISVNADDTDGNVMEVRFEIDNIGVSSAISYPYNYEWSTSDVETGIHTIRAVAKDNEDCSTSDEINIVIANEDTIGTVTDYDENTYNTIKIGTQWWMAENLKVTHYSGGVEIELVEDSSLWDALSYNNKAMCYHSNSMDNANIYGALYTWAATTNNTRSNIKDPVIVQGVCPDGWHIPNDEEWTELIIYLGGDSIAGGKLKEVGTTFWCNPNTGANNESGFSALPGGSRYEYGSFGNLRCWARFWSATEAYISTSASYYALRHDATSIHRFTTDRTSGFSVRCVKD